MTEGILLAYKDSGIHHQIRGREATVRIGIEYGFSRRGQSRIRFIRLGSREASAIALQQAQEQSRPALLPVDAYS